MERFGRAKFSLARQRFPASANLILAVACVLIIVPCLLYGWQAGFSGAIGLVMAGVVPILILNFGLAAKIIRDASAAKRKLHDLHRTVDHLPVLISYLDPNQRFLFCNSFYSKVANVPAEQVVGKSIREVFGEEIHARLQDKIAQVLAGNSVDFQQRLPIDGIQRDIQTNYLPDFDQAGKVIGYFALGRDITAQKEAEHALKESDERIRLLVEHIPVMVGYVDADEQVTFANGNYETAFGATQVGEKKKSARDMLGPGLYDFCKPYIAAALNGERVDFERMVERDGIVRYERVSYVPDIDQNGKVRGYFSLLEDITALKLAEAQLIRLAKFDSLTGLANRNQFNDSLRAAIARAGRKPATLGLIFLDVDRFKAINDELGHQIGDEVLVEIAKRLKACTRVTDTVARLSGDEFVIILEGMHTPPDAEVVARKIIESMREQFRTTKGMRVVSVSIGVAIHRNEESDPAALISRADGALYRAKESGRNRFSLEP